MELWVAIASVDSEPGYLIGVYDSKEKANDACYNYRDYCDEVWSGKITVNKEEYISV